MKYGAEFGWTIKNGNLLYDVSIAPKAGKWDLMDEVAKGSKSAKQLQKALEREGTRQVRAAIRNISRRKTVLTGAQAVYEKRAAEILTKQLQRLREPNSNKKQLTLQNIYRAPTEKAFRQAPLERASLAGIKAREQKGIEQLHKALQSPNFVARVPHGIPETMQALEEICKIMGVSYNIWGNLSKYKAEYGDPYKAAEKVYEEVSELSGERYSTLSQEERDNIAGNPKYVETLIMLGLVDVPSEF